jgi:phosphatidylserine decarboxylase
MLLALAVLGILGMLVWWRGGWWVAALALWTPLVAWILIFFRNPERPGPRAPHLVVSPADGRITEVVTTSEPEFIGGPATRISVFMNVFDVHVNRYPVSGIVEHRRYRPGTFLNATLDKASEDNERMSLGIRTARGPILVRQIAGLIARRIVTDAQVGDSVSQGERLGMIRFGSRVDTFVPAAVQIRITPGERTKAGVTVLGEWPS